MRPTSEKDSLQEEKKNEKIKKNTGKLKTLVLLVNFIELVETRSRPRGPARQGARKRSMGGTGHSGCSSGVSCQKRDCIRQ